MSLPPSGLITQVLEAAAAGELKATEELLPLVYAELKRLAASQLVRTPPGNTLQPTALVHEAYLKLVGTQSPSWECRGHFFAAAAEAMRQILVDQARRKTSRKRGGGRRRVDLDPDQFIKEMPDESLILLHEALEALEKSEPRVAQVVKLRFFAGLTMPEIAPALGISLPTAERDWRFGRTFLSAKLEENED
ncbi:MAG TPA: ECF-type sigma factor [Phycisphaerae bacterium]|nr:ECF-type sigma factor [Phycisphaerae bacterium]